jgi:hypothetical protein
MADSWTVSVGGRNYGPYTATQMKAFAAEGRLAPQSLVCPAGDTALRPASEFHELSGLFRPAERSATSRQQPQPVSTFGRSSRDSTGERSQFVIMADMKSGSVAALEAEVFNLGPAYPVLPHVWIVSSESSVNAIRNLLVQKLGKRDAILVVDTAHNKAAWFNFGPETEARIRSIWSKTPDLSTTQSVDE